MGRNGEESVEKKCTSNLDTGLIRGIILMIIPLSNPLNFVLVARNQIRITGAFFLTDSSTVSNHRKRSSLCLCAGKLLILRSSSPSILLFLPPVISSTRTHPITGAASRRPPVEYSKAGTSKFCFFMLESGEESVVKRQPVIWIWFRVSYTKSRGLLSRIIIKIIQRISPVSKITGYLFTYGLFAAFSS